MRVLGVDVKSVKVSRAITRLRFIEHEKTKELWHQLIKDYLHTNFHACGASGFGETLLTRIFRKKLNDSVRGQSSKMVLPSVHFVHQDTSVCIISSRYLVRIKSYEKLSKILDDLDLDICSRSKVTEDIPVGFVSLRQIVYELSIFTSKS